MTGSIAMNVSLTLEETLTLARNGGLGTLPADQLERLQMMAARALTAGRAVPRMASEFHEPAHVFIVPELTHHQEV
jgi:hypothetical protein